MDMVDQTAGFDLTNIVERTWEEIGFSVRATGYKVWLRTLPHPRKYKGLIWLPETRSGFYGEPVHQNLVFAVVLSVGPKARSREELPPGTVVGFRRVNFGWMMKLAGANPDEYGSDDEYVGFLMNAEDINLVKEEEDESVEQFPDLRVAV